MRKSLLYSGKCGSEYGWIRLISICDPTLNRGLTRERKLPYPTQTSGTKAYLLLLSSVMLLAVVLVV